MWKSVAPDYEVSTDGQVRSWKSGEPKILKPAPSNRGYLQVELQIDGKPKLYLIHRLVAQAFIPNPLNKPQVNHLNGVKTDNRVENLEWCTASENRRHAFVAGLQHALQGDDCPWAKLTDEQVVYIRDNPDRLSRKTLAKKFNVHEGTISEIQLGQKRKSAGGVIRESKRLPVSDDVRDEIRRLYCRGKHGCGSVTLGKKFGVNPQTVLNIVHEGQR